MDKGCVQIICGNGLGKSSMALGRGIGAVTEKKRVIMIQFLKGLLSPETADWLKNLEPDLKVFRFEKQSEYFERLSDTQKEEERINIHNGLNFARKVLTTGECDLLILDEFLGILDQKLITPEEAIGLLKLREEGVSVILTGKVFPQELTGYVDCVTRIESETYKD